MNRTKKLKVIALTAIFTVILCTAAFVGVSLMGGNSPATTSDTSAVPTETTTEATTEPPEPYVVSTATIGSAGDVLLHVPVYENAQKSDGTYDFSHLFTYCEEVIEGCDYFVANLETTLGGTDGRTYKGYPRFNSPDAIVKGLKQAGVDCLLTANNHTYDTGSAGVKRTLSVIDESHLAHVGTRSSTDEKRYIVEKVNDISFGIACYTYETETTEGRKALNGILVDTDTAKLINSFDYNNLIAFYKELKSDIAAMKAEGAEVTVVYIHWGNEYQLEQNSYQTKIAQKLCEMGVDVIIGGHPHVVQPVDILTSEDGGHQTVCVYSLGNMVSNQRRAYMGLKTGHTEDGLIFTMTFSKYSDGTVTFDKVKCIPTWVHLYTSGGKKIHAVTPLSSNLDEKASELGLNNSSDGLSLAKGSYERTMALVGEGEKKINKALAKEKNKLKKGVSSK